MQAVTLYCPEASVAAPVVEPFTVTETPESFLPLSSDTVPETVCAFAVVRKEKE